MSNTLFEDNIELSLFHRYRINCSACCGLCCVVLYFTKSDGFPKDKKAGVVCDHLQEEFKCRVHSELWQRGLKGCVTYDCFGAGQFMTSRMKSDHKWRSFLPDERDQMIASYLVVLEVHQILWYLSQCLILRLPQQKKEQAQSLINEGSELIEQKIEMLALLDTKQFRDKANEYLKHICSLYSNTIKDFDQINDKNFMGKNLSGKNLENMDFSMSLLIAANLEGAKLNGANFLGADLRDTNVCNTDLSQCIFLTRLQLNSARTNEGTVWPSYLVYPEIF